jgi:hypothetical protein
VKKKQIPVLGGYLKQEHAPAVIRVVLRVHEVLCSTKIKDPVLVYITTVLKKIEKNQLTHKKTISSQKERKSAGSLSRFFKLFEITGAGGSLILTFFQRTGEI